MAAAPTLLDDRNVDFLLYEVFDAPALGALPAFEGHGRETFDLYLSSVRRLARQVLFPTYRVMDAEPPRFEGGRVLVHPRMKTLYPQLVAVGAVAATRPADVGGQALPLTVATLAHAYLMAGNLGAYGYVGLTTGAAHLLEAFGKDAMSRELMTKLYTGEWTGTMALTEPQAGSSLADVATRATPRPDGTYLLRGSKIFISGGDHDVTDNIVHMVLARIDGAPPGTKGISLFAVPKRRPDGDDFVDNDVAVSGLIHKIGWKGLPSVALELGERGDCRGWLVGEPHRGLAHMFQMMNEARLMVGVNGAATASAAYLASLEYARTRPQGRPLSAKDPTARPVPIVAHADVRRMLLRQKAIVEGSLALVTKTALYADLAAHGADERDRADAQALLDALTPVAKTFPAEYGFEANALAVQVHGGYGYSSEYLPEAWLRDQKLNTLHEGTTGIQGLDLLGRRMLAGGGRPLALLAEEIGRAVRQAREAGVDESLGERLTAGLETLVRTSQHLGGLGASGDVEAMLRHSTDYLQLTSIVVTGWLWLLQATVARRALAEQASTGGQANDRDFYEGKLCAAQYWLHTELPRTEALSRLCITGEDSYARMQDAWF